MKNEKFCFNKGVGLATLIGIVLVVFVLASQTLTNTKTSTNSRASAPGGNTREAGNYIFGGSGAYVGQYPYLVALIDNTIPPAPGVGTPVPTRIPLDRRARCSGILLNNSWIATAKHCKTDFEAMRGDVKRDMLIYGVGDTTVDISTNAFTRNIIDIQDPDFFGDIILMQMNAAVSVSRYPILADKDTYYAVGNAFTIAGFGQTSSTSLYSNFLRYAPSKVTTSNTYSNFRSNCFLGIGTNKESICQGDSGGPALVGDVLIGITYGISKGSTCGTATENSFSRIFERLDKIKKIILTPIPTPKK